MLVMSVMIVIQGYKKQKAYIVAQDPLQSTVKNFWKVIVDKKCGVVVMLSHLKENKEVIYLARVCWLSYCSVFVGVLCSVLAQ